MHTKKQLPRQQCWLSNVGAVFIVAVAFTCATHSTAQPLSDTHLECVGDVYPPYTTVKDGVVSGIGADMLVAAGRLASLKITLKILPYSRIENEFKHGAESAVACAYAFSRTPEREPYMLFGNAPMSVTRYVLFAKSSQAKPVYSGVAALKGARVGVRFAFRVPSAIQQAADRGELTLESVNDDELNFRKLGLGRLDYVLTNQDVGEALIRRLHLTGTQAMLPAIEEFPIFAVFNKAMERAPAWRAAVDKGLLAARANGTEARIRSQYLR